MLNFMEIKIDSYQGPRGACPIPLPCKQMNFDEFFEDVNTINNELKELQNLNGSLHSSHELSKNLHSAEAVRDMKARMDADITMALQKGKFIKACLEKLVRSKLANRAVPGCGPGSSVDLNTSFTMKAQRKYLKDVMESFNALGNMISTEYREILQERYFTVTRENPDDRSLDHFVSTGEIEAFLHNAIRDHGRDRIADTINEIEERHGAFGDMEKSLKELQQVFLDMAAVLQVEEEDEQKDDIPSQVGEGKSLLCRLVNYCCFRGKKQ